MELRLGDLIERCLTGDAHAQKALYEEFAPRIHTLAVRMVGEFDGPDVTQQSFVKMFRCLGTFKGQANFSTWLYRIAINECLQHRRRKRQSFKPLPPDLLDRAPRPDERTEQAELLEKSLASLDEGLRAVFLLREVDGLSYEQIAEVMDIPSGTVASQLNRARAELRAYLSKVMSE